MPRNNWLNLVRQAIALRGLSIRQASLLVGQAIAFCGLSIRQATKTDRLPHVRRRSSNWSSFVGQAIAFCGLSIRQATKTDRLPHVRRCSSNWSSFVGQAIAFCGLSIRQATKTDRLPHVRRRSSNWLSFVGQAIAFCGLSIRQATKTDRLPHGRRGSSNWLSFVGQAIAFRGLSSRRSNFVPCALLLLCAPCIMSAQPSPELQQILQRLDRIESQNRELMAEVQALRQQLDAAKAPPAPAESAPIADRVEVQDRRIAQLDQEKISSEHKLPITLTGMLLFNSFWTGRGAGGTQDPTTAALIRGPVDAGGTFRQSVVGIKFDGPTIVGGAKITGSAYVDFFGGTGGTLNQMLRVRVASVDAAWANTTVSVALDKPILAPREPDSLAQVGVSPLTAAGNLWLWQPQVRVEQRFHFGDQAGLRAQAGIYQTAEGGTGLSSQYPSAVAAARPGLEGRFEFWAASGENRRIEIAPGFHVSDSQVLGQSVPSRIFSVDWLIRPVSRIDFTGEFFQGENTGVIGGLRQGVSVFGGVVRPVEAMGGWAQIKLRLTPRATLNFYGGQEDDRNRDLEPGGIAKNQAYAGNFMYRFGSNILGSLETAQVRTTYLNSGTRIFPHYDLAIAYLF